MSSRLLHAAPSAPSDTVMPRARISATGAMPDPSFRFEPGQCITLTSCSASSCLLALVDPHAVRGAQARRRQADGARGTRCWSGRRIAARTIAISSRDSDACVCTSAPCSADRLRHGFEQLARARDGEPRRERGAQPAVGRAVPALADARRSRRSTPRVCSCSRGGTVGVGVHHALADRRAHAALGRRPRTPTSVSCTVSIVSTAVVPLQQQLGRREPRRGAQRRRRVRGFHRPDARPQPVHQRADRRRSRGTASGRDGCASG